MRLVFTNEESVTYLSIAFTAQEREVIDARCAALGMTSARTKSPCKMVGEASFPCWKSPQRNTFLESVFSRIQARIPEHVVDGINDPLFTGDDINLALLRIQLPPDTPAKFRVMDGFVSPHVIQSYEIAIAEAMRSLYTAQVESNVEITFTVGRARE